MRDTPVILKEDISLLTNGIISENDIYAIREGEKIRSSIDGDTYYSSMELIKLRPILVALHVFFMIQRLVAQSMKTGQLYAENMSAGVRT